MIQAIEKFELGNLKFRFSQVISNFIEYIGHSSDLTQMLLSFITKTKRIKVSQEFESLRKYKPKKLNRKHELSSPKQFLIKVLLYFC